MMSLNDFVHNYGLRNKATSNTKTYQVIFSIGLDKVDVYI